MMRLNRTSVWVCAISGASVLSAGPAMAASHLWRINELFTNASGTVQFIELKECCGAMSELGLLNKMVTSQATGSVFAFPADLVGNTAGRHLLLATAAFAALPGAPTPDHIINSNFFAINGDTIRWSPVDNYDTFTYGAGVLPTNGVNCLQMTNFMTHTFVTTGANTPTNYGGQTGSVGCVDPDGDGYGSPGSVGCSMGSAEDCNNNIIAINPGATEVCTDDLDNDCDGAADCLDTFCANVVPCVPAVSEFGLLVLGLLVLTGGSVVMLRHRATRST